MPVIIPDLTLRTQCLSGKHLDDLPNNCLRRVLAQCLAQSRPSVSISE